MGILLLLIPLSIVLVGTAIYWFLWAVDNAQFDDVDKHALQALADDEVKQSSTRKQAQNRADRNNGGKQ